MKHLFRRLINLFMPGIMEASGTPHTSAACYTPGVTQSVAYTAVAGTLTNPTVSNIVRLSATSVCFVKYGFDPATVATTADMYMKTDDPAFFNIPPGSYISAVQATAGGTLYVTEMS